MCRFLGWTMPIISTLVVLLMVTPPPPRISSPEVRKHWDTTCKAVTYLRGEATNLKADMDAEIDDFRAYLEYIPKTNFTRIEITTRLRELEDSKLGAEGVYKADKIRWTRQRDRVLHISSLPFLHTIGSLFVGLEPRFTHVGDDEQIKQLKNARFRIEVEDILDDHIKKLPRVELAIDLFHFQINFIQCTPGGHNVLADNNWRTALADVHKSRMEFLDAISFVARQTSKAYRFLGFHRIQEH